MLLIATWARSNPCGQEIIIIPKLLTERVGMVLKTAEYYLMNLAKNSQVKVGKMTCRSCNSRTWLFHVHCWTLPDFSFLLSITYHPFTKWLCHLQTLQPTQPHHFSTITCSTSGCVTCKLCSSHSHITFPPSPIQQVAVSLANFATHTATSLLCVAAIRHLWSEIFCQTLERIHECHIL